MNDIKPEFAQSVNVADMEKDEKLNLLITKSRELLSMADDEQINQILQVLQLQIGLALEEKCKRMGLPAPYVQIAAMIPVDPPAEEVKPEDIN